MFRSLPREAPVSAACERVQALVRAHFTLGDDAHVLADEQPTLLPGCPPRQTVVDFWTDLDDGSTQRHHCKVFKPACEVGPDDLPPYWMKNALAVPPDWVCECC
jgi:hypothetical protein